MLLPNGLPKAFDIVPRGIWFGLLANNTSYSLRSIQKRIDEIKLSPLPDASEKKKDRESFFIDERDEIRSSDEHGKKQNATLNASISFTTDGPFSIP
jgi:hypothetical protein